MSERVNRIFEVAKELSRQERAEIAERLLDSLEDDGEPVDQAAIDAAWIAECDRRFKEYQNGEMKSVPIEDILDKLGGRKKPT